MHAQITIHETPLGRQVEIYESKLGNALTFALPDARTLASELVKALAEMDEADKQIALKDAEKAAEEKKNGGKGTL